MNSQLRILALQPYYGGSHAQFHGGWTANSSHLWTTLTLPPRHWKWRMRHASIHFSEDVRRMADDGQSWDVVVCTDMLNLAEWKGLIGPEIAGLPVIIYFHENQFAYPIRTERQRDHHFPFTNFISALAADGLWFNSRFNFDSMMEGLRAQTRNWPDYVPTDAIESLASKMEVHSPGIENPPIDVDSFFEQRQERAANHEPLRIVWAARWEHDKNANDLLEALKLLDRSNVPFQISVIGQSFRYLPPVFAEIQTKFSQQIRRWGFQESREQFWEALAEADVFVSTANHEFFGLAAAEAIASGLHPLLPNRLAYPELLKLAFDKKQIANRLYDGSATGLADALHKLHQDRMDGVVPIGDREQGIRLIEKIGWAHQAKQLDAALADVMTTN